MVLIVPHVLNRRAGRAKMQFTTKVHWYSRTVLAETLQARNASKMSYNKGRLWHPNRHLKNARRSWHQRRVYKVSARNHGGLRTPPSLYTPLCQLKGGTVSGRRPTLPKPLQDEPNRKKPRTSQVGQIFQPHKKRQWTSQVGPVCHTE